MLTAETEMPVEQNADSNLLNLLIVDDERTVRESCREVADALGFHTTIADSPEHCYRALDGTNVDVVLLDLRLPGTNGMEVLREIKRRRPDTVVVIMTGFATVQSAVQAMKSGAYDYVTKPFNFDELRLVLDRVTAHLKLATENRLLREQVKSKHGFGAIVGQAPEMDRLYRIIAKAASSTHPVLILGESGTGKELVARSIHYSGPFRDKPFIPVDCGSLVPTLIESELFGYVKGAFTGAVRAKDGLMAAADGGTIFLDEVGELPVDLQAKLLRALQEKEIRPVGGTRAIPISVRVLAATNRDLEAGGAAGNFPPRFVLPSERADIAGSTAAGAQAGHPSAGGTHSRTRCAHHGRTAQYQRRRAETHAQLRMAGKRARTGELSGTCLRADLGPNCPHRRSADRLAEFSCAGPGSGRQL